ncbi:hypothetical protein [Pseudobacillus badius]|uniref:hypothetical protein n=1 Tax=Bacillus badius TaxID=1455 RepID=UPI0024A01138|nr:hypothetical protein [Bacillus badius]GLY11384.1 hypothetical protein Bbad01_26000 [Bacillus badius]
MKRYVYITPEDYETAEKNGINRNTLEYRVRYGGFDIDRAITEPVAKREPWTPEQRAKLKESQLGESTVRERMKKWGISRDEALAIPKFTPEETFEQLKKGFEEKHCVFSREQRQKMKENGIKHATAYARWKYRGYTKEEAVTIPTQTHRQIKERTIFNKFERRAQ